MKGFATLFLFLALIGSEAFSQPAKPGVQPAANPARPTIPADAKPVGSATSAIPSNAKQVGSAAPAPSPTSESPVETMLSEDLIRSLRDPFQLPAILLSKKDLPKTELETFPLKDFKLNGVITGPKKTRAMVTAPGNKVFFVRIGDKIGVREGTVTQILADGIKIMEYTTDEHGRKIPDNYELTMNGELVSLSKKEY